MIAQLREVFGHSRWATALSIIIQAIIFGVGHMYYQGLRGLFVTGGGALMLASCLYSTSATSGHWRLHMRC